MNATDNWQWIIAAIMPFLREFNLWMQLKITRKAAKTYESSVEIYRTFFVNNKHCTALCTTMGSMINNFSTWALLVADSIFSGYLAMKLIWVKRQQPMEENIKGAAFHLMTLFVTLIVETVVPVAVLINFLLFYYEILM